MARNVTVYFADGSRHEYQGVPDDATPEQVAARAGREFQGKQIRHIERAPAAEAATSDTTRNPFMGALARGAELVGSGIETLGRAGEALGDIIAEKAPILDTRLMIDREGIRIERPTEEDIRDKNQLQYMQDWADSFRNWGREINYEPSTKLGELADNPLNAVPFIVERVIASSPDMVAAATALPAYIPTRANEILNERLKNDDRSLSEATIGDVAAATGAAVVEGTLERFATRRLVKEGAEAATATRRIGKEAAVQAGTEAAEEVGAYAGETAGTRAGFDPRTAGLTALEAAIVGGGLGAGAQGVKEIFGTRPGEPTTEEAVTEEEEFPSAEALAPKEGRVARPSPVRAKTLEELRGQMPAAPKVEDEVKAPREPMVFERTKEPTPEAVQEATEFATQFPEGGKDFNLFKARSIAKKLGYEGVTNKTTRADVEPLIRSALAPRETITPAEDVVVGQNAAGEPLYERQDGSRYRMRFDRADRPAGYPDFGGDLAPVEAGQEVTVPETAQVDVLAGKEIRPPTDDIYEVAEANFNYPRMIGNQTVPIEQLEGGVTAQAGERKRVDELANQIASDEGYFTRIIVDQNNNVIEGQHRLEALRKLGAKEVPVFKIEDMGDTFPVMKMEAAVLKAQPMREEQASQIVKRALNAVAETGSVQEAAKLEIPGFQKGYAAALNVIEPVVPAAEVPSEPTRAGVSEAVVGAGARGAELPVPRVGAAGPEVTTAPPAGLERPSGAAPRVDEGKAVRPAALEPAAFTIRNDGIEGQEVSPSQVPNGSEAFQYAIGKVEEGGPTAVFRRRADERGTYGGWRVETDVNKLIEPTPAAAPTRIFESIDVLNRPKASFIDELGRERAPSLRVELKKAKKDYDAGILTGDQLAETTGNLLLKTQKERVVRPRARGADYIRERLMNARRNGYISQEGVDLAEWFIRQNPLLVDDLGISIRGQRLADIGTGGFYNPVSRIITLFKSAGDSQTATHEILHHLERLMPAVIRSGILKAYNKQLIKAARNAKTDAEKVFFNAITNYHYFDNEANRNAEYKKALDAIQTGQVPKSYYQYVNPSEFWAVNGSRIVQGRYGIPPGIVGQIKKWLRDFIEKAKDLFGLKSDAAVIRALDSLAKADGKYQTEQLLAEAPGYRSVEPTAEKPKKAKPAKPKKSVLEVTKEASDKMVQPGVVRQVINKLVGPETNYENIVKKFQNVNRVVKKIQEDLRATGKLVYVGPDKNNIDDESSAAANRGSYVVATEVEPVAKRLRESLADYARTIQGTIKDALDKASSYRIALHEPERRETKYLRNVPLNNTTKEEFLPGEPAMTAADARMELEKRRSLTKDKAQAEALQDMIRYLVANYADSRGYSPVKARLQEAGKPTPEEMTTDFYDDIYNVIGPEYTQEELEATRQEYESLDAKTKAAVDQVFNDLDALHELNKNLNRRANYWTDKVDRVIESYGWKHYIPFKGSPKSDKTFDTDTEYLSGELSETPQSFEGRRTNFDNPILQTISESYFAASRAGRGTDVTTTIKNLIKLGVIKSKKMKKFTFEERNSPDFDYNEVRGRDKVLHYNEDGSVEVYSLKDPEVLEAIKTPFREMNLATKIGNAITGTLGQLHTRFNPAFAPMDFVRNSLTNAGLISAREGGKEARDYLTAVAANVARLGWWKSGKLSYALASNNTAELDRLAKKSPFYRDALEMMKYGGRTMYRLSFNIAETMQDIQKQIGPKKIIKDPSMFMRILDAYNDAFELTSRVAAYTVRKQQKIAEAKKQGLKVSDPKVMEDINKEAAAFALSLMDFRKIGKYGKELGAWFMFIRPAATGAVDAIDALRPGFFLKPSSVAGKAYTRLEPEIKELFETKTLAEEIKRIQGNKRPDKKKIAALEQEIVQRQKDFDAFEARQLNRAKNARNTAMFTIAAGAALYGMAAAVSGEDDEGRNRVTTDDMSRWTRYLRLPVIGDDGFFQIPWGFGVSALMSAGAQFAAVASGASSFKDFAGNMVEIGMDSFLPIPTSRINPFENFGAWLIDSATPSAARPVVEFVLNVDAMGNPIYNSRAGKYADAFSGSTRPSELHRQITETIFNMTDGEVSVSPDTVAFALNNYADGINHLAENSYNMFLTATGDKEFDAKKDTFILRSFIGRNSNYDARKFAEAEKEIKDLAQRMKTFEDLGTPEQVLRFYRKNPNADILVDIYNKGVNGELKRLQSERKQLMLDKNLTPKERDRYVEDIRVQENYIKKLLVEDFEAYKDN